jgi:single-stranded-DNA-specific exonuclease
MGNPEWRPSLVGLAANKLAEEHKRPVFLWGRDGKEQYKGSCRAGGGKSVVKIMEAAPQLFTEFGGHHASGGFTVVPEHIHAFAEQLTEAASVLGESAAIHEPLQVDRILSLQEVTKELLAAQVACGPFGCDNPKPIYLIKEVVPKSVEVFGKSKEHTKVSLPSIFVKEAIAFFKTPSDFTVTPEENKTISLLAELEESYFMNRRQVRLRIIDVII